MHIKKIILYTNIYVVIHCINILIFLFNIYLQFTISFYTFTKYKNLYQTTIDYILLNNLILSNLGVSNNYLVKNENPIL